jgi:RNA 2',3'-cyclic 3'-phosphodiesterase
LKGGFSVRLFVAIQFSSEILTVLQAAISSLRVQSDSGNFTQPDNLHLTLAFLGETNKLCAAKSAMELCSVAPFELAVSGFGHFGKLYWVGIEKNPALSELAENLHNELRQLGFNIENREFKPHITIAREVVSAAPPRIDIPRTVMTARRISLMLSDRIGGRLTYTELYGKAL